MVDGEEVDDVEEFTHLGAIVDKAVKLRRSPRTMS